MGMYDTVSIDCPSCGSAVDFQSKAGGCGLKHYTLDDLPVSMAGDLDSATCLCKCGKDVSLSVAHTLKVS